MESLNIALKNLKLNNVSFLENISFHFNIGCPLAEKKKTSASWFTPSQSSLNVLLMKTGLQHSFPLQTGRSSSRKDDLGPCSQIHKKSHF